jgi:hypothetical protein
MAALFPTSLYSTDATILNTSLSQTEWQQVAYEIAALEATLGTTPSGTATTVATFLTALSTGAGLTATGHGALGTAATHPFSGLTGTFTAVQHGAIPTGGTHPFSALTGTFTAAQHGALGTAATHPFSGLTGTFTMAQHGVLSGTAASHPASALTNIYGTTVVTTPTGGAPRSRVTVPIPAGVFSAVPQWGIIVADGNYAGASAMSLGAYEQSNVANSVTSAVFVVYHLDGSNYASGIERFNVLVGL